MKLFFLTLLFVSISNLSAFSQWQQTAGPRGGMFISAVYINSDLYALTASGGVFKYNQDSGWSRQGLLYGYHYEMAASGNSLFIRSQEGVFRSSDQGKTWSRQIAGFSGMFLASPNVLFTSVNDTIYKTTDGGLSWSKPLISTTANTLLFGDSTLQNLIDIQAAEEEGSVFLLSCTASVYPLPKGIYVTTDRGARWQFASGLPEPSYVSDFEQIGSEYFLCSFDGIYRSTDNGLSWSEINNGLPQIWTSGPVPIQQLLNINNSLYARAQDEFQNNIFKLVDGKWELVSSGVAASHIASYGDELLILSRSGIYSYNGSTVSDLNLGLTASRAYPYAAGKNLVFAYTESEFFRTSDGGSSWQLINSFHPNSLISDKNFIYAGSLSGLYISSDEGLTWLQKGEGLPSVYKTSVSAFAADDNFIYAGFFKIRTRDHLPSEWEAGGIYKSADHGNTWSSASQGIKHTGSVPAPVNSLAAAGNILIALTSDGIYRSDNQGSSWYRFSAGLPSNLIGGSITPLKNSIYFQTTAGIYRVAEELNEWQSVSAGLPENPFLYTSSELVIIDDTIYLIGTYLEKSVYALAESNWIPSDMHLPENLVFNSFSSSDNILFAGTTDSGIWKLNQNTSVVNEDVKIKNYSLLQNYPNPFNPSTRIDFHLEKAGNVTLKVYDILGREAAVLLNEHKPSGFHTVSFTAENLSSGIYLYVMESGSFRDVKKMHLLK